MSRGTALSGRQLVLRHLAFFKKWASRLFSYQLLPWGTWLVSKKLFVLLTAAMVTVFIWWRVYVVKYCSTSDNFWTSPSKPHSAAGFFVSSPDPLMAALFYCSWQYSQGQSENCFMHNSTSSLLWILSGFWMFLMEHHHITNVDWEPLLEQWSWSRANIQGT